MSLDKGYGILKCQAVDRALERDDQKSPHFQVLGRAGQDSYRLAINVKSTQKPFDLLYWIDDNFQHPITQQLVTLELGFNALEPSEQKAGGIALDYIRGNLLDVSKMRPLPADAPGQEDDLHDLLDLYIQRALNNADVDLYVFGEPWPPEAKPDKIFDFKPGQGIHNIHMNQGSKKPFGQENGVYQDGGLFLHFRDRDQWVAAFFAFQSQSFHTDDQTGNPLPGRVGTESITRTENVVQAAVQIVSALVNPTGSDPGRETVTLVNTTRSSIDLEGWMLADRFKRKQVLSGTIEASSTRTISLSGQEMQLGNDGGIITLLNPEGIKVAGVSYTKSNAQQQGRLVVF
jgi:uncharacterized protein YukJ